LKQENPSKVFKLSLVDVFIIFIQNKSKIFILSSIICIISIIVYFFVLDLIYISNASIKSSSKGSGLLGGFETSLPDIGGLDDLGLGGSKSAKELALYQEILFSRRCLEQLIIKFDLMTRDEYQFMEEAIKNFRENQLLIEVDRISGIMNVSVLDKDKKLAKEMVEFLLMELDKINIEMNIQNAKSNREFIERRYIQAKVDLANSEDSLKSFQMIYGIAPDLQIKASAQSMFTLEGELKAEEVKLEVLKNMLSSDQPEVKMQEAKVNALKSKISEINVSTDLSEFLRLGNSPQIAMSFLRLQRDLEIQTKILTFLLPVYEQAKIEEKRETPSIVVLDKPFIAEKKTKPKRLTMVLIFTFLGFFFSILVFVTIAKLREFSNDLKKKLVDGYSKK
jgi:tyrosine-protein kinase Etk/Wzc